MDYDAEDRREEREAVGRTPQMTEEQNPTPQFQLVLRTTDGL